MKRILFVCIHNSARSQMAEAFINHSPDASLKAFSAGLEPGKLNPVVVEAMKEIEIDISGNETTSVQSLLDRGENYDYIVTVCDEASAEKCPIFPGEGERLHWGFPDPSALKGDFDTKLAGTRAIRDKIRKKVLQWMDSLT